MKLLSFFLASSLAQDEEARYDFFNKFVLITIFYSNFCSLKSAKNFQIESKRPG